MKPDKNWHKKFFQNKFYNPASKEAVKMAAFETNFIIKKTGLKKGCSVLDLCCGPGRHSLVFAKKGYIVTGVDFSRQYLAQAKKEALKKGLSAKFIRKDARDINFSQEFDLALCLFTSFGYMVDEKDDLLILKNLSRSLKNDGFFVLDIINKEYLLKNFKPKNFREINPNCFLLEETRLLKGGEESFNTWIKINRGKVQKRDFFLRLYDKKKISKILKKAGFYPLKFFGDFYGSKFSPESQRLIAICSKRS